MHLEQCWTWLISSILMLISWPMGQAAFDESPGTEQTYMGSSVTLEWIWSNALGNGHSIEFYFLKGTNLVPLGSVQFGMFISTGPYVGRVSYYSQSAQSTGFTLNDVKMDDAGTYRCSVEQPPSPVIHSYGTVFILSQPGKPTINVNKDPVTAGDTLTLTCSAAATSQPAAYRPDMMYSWNEGPYTNSNTLVIPDINKSENGEDKQCVAREEGSNIESSATSHTVTVYWSPTQPTAVAMPGSYVVENTSDTVTLVCNITDNGNPAATSMWSKDGVDNAHTQPTFPLTPVSVNDHDGSWTCTLSNDVNSVTSAPVDVIVRTKPSVTLQPSDKVLRDEDPLSVSCQFRGKPSVIVEWKSSEGQGDLPPALKYDTSTVAESPPNQKYTITTTNLTWNVGDLRLRQSATGRYHCIGTNAAVAEPETSEHMHLNITFAPHSVTAIPSSDEATEGESSSTSCSAECNPNCWSYEWTKQSNSSFLRHGQDLQFSNVHRNDHGVFECRASNGLEPVPSASAEYGLIVNYAPEFDVSKSTVTAQEGETVTLQCDIDSRPDPTALDWYNQTGAMQHTSKTGRQVIVEMNNVDCPDAGTYQCKATNKIDSRESAVVTLVIKCSPNVVGTEPADRLASSAIGDTVIFKVMLYANPDPTLKWEFIHTSNDSVGDWPGNVEVVIVDNGVSRIIISRVVELNFGKYRCHGTNTFGSLRGGPVDFELRAHVQDSTDNTLVIIGAVIAVVVVLVVIGVVLLVLIRRGTLPGMKKKTDSGSKDVLELGGTTHAMYEEATGETAAEMKTPSSVTYENASTIPPESGLVVYENSTLQTPPAPATYEEIHLLESSTYQNLDPKSRVPQEMTEYAAISSQSLDVVAEDIVLGEVLHQGHIFTLRSGRMKERDVVATSLTALPGSTCDDRHKLTAEISATLSAGTHQHVLSALGTTRIHDQECILYPLMKNGDLCAFLRTKKNSPDYENFQDGLSSNILLRFALDVARGMAYLHTKEFLHPCLRSSAVLLGAGNVCKVAGFLTKKGAIAQLSLTRKLEELPVRWLAPEVIEDYTAINSKSDIWSYGVLLWEIYELGGEPYSAMTADDVIKYVCEGNTLTKPKRCSTAVYDVMKRCWLNTFKLRLSFESVVECEEEMS